jgi:hypothetical protein
VRKPALSAVERAGLATLEGGSADRQGQADVTYPELDEGPRPMTATVAWRVLILVSRVW